MTHSLRHLHDLPDLLGFAAAGLVLLTFYVRSGAAMRAAAIASNLLFITYASAQGLLPVLVLHALLLPLNVWRLCELANAAGRRRQSFERWPRAMRQKRARRVFRPAARRVRPLSQRPQPPPPPPRPPPPR